MAETRQPALLVVGHGSRIPEAEAEMTVLTDLLRERTDATVAHGWIELQEPRGEEAALALVASGEQAITLVPLLAFDAHHAGVDLPEAAAAVRRGNPEVDVRVARALGPDPRLLDLVADRVADAGALDAVVLVASGTSDADVQTQVAELARALEKRTGVPTVHAFASLADPEVATALRALPAGSRRVAVASWSVLDGRLSRGAYATARDWAEDRGRDLVTLGHLGPDAVVADVLLDRYTEAAPLG